MAEPDLRIPLGYVRRPERVGWCRAGGEGERPSLSPLVGALRHRSAHHPACSREKVWRMLYVTSKYDRTREVS